MWQQMQRLTGNLQPAIAKSRFDLFERLQVNNLFLVYASILLLFFESFLDDFSFPQIAIFCQASRHPRAEDMSADQDWPNVWPAARSFRSSVVPLPVRMGSRPKLDRRAPFPAKGNLELVKIPNFLHLTPLHIKRHCEAIKSLFDL
jgi:hypothetical protein